MAAECMMPHCTWDAFREGLCDQHYAQAYPSDDEVRVHIRRENKRHPFSVAQAKADHHERQRRARRMAQDPLSVEEVAKIFDVPTELLLPQRRGWHDMGRMGEEGLT